MRLGFLHVFLPPVGIGGVAYQVDLLASAMAARGHDVTVVTSIAAPGLRSYRNVVMPPVRLGLLTRGIGTSLGFRRADLSGFDVIHAHGDDWAVGARPLVRTFHGSARQEARWATSRKRKLSQQLQARLERVSARRATVTVAVSENTRREVPGIDRVIPNAVDPAVFHPAVHPDDERFQEPTALLVAGLLGGRKRGHLIVAAFRQLRRRLPNARLVIVSRDAVDEPGIECFAAISPDKLGDLFRRSWVLCSASSYEGFGLPYAEAMLSGLPIVTTANAGADEVLEGGRLGMVVAPEDLVGGLERMLTDRAEMERYRDAGLLAGRRYLLDAVTAEYEDVYRLAMT